MEVKLALVMATCALLSFSLLACRRAPDPADTVRNAYGWYVRELKSGVHPLQQKRTQLRHYVTDRFLSSIDNMRADLESSPFVDGQSFDARISIGKVKNNGSTATVRVELNGRLFGQHTLDVYLVKVDGRWKVDDVKRLEQSSLDD